MSDTKVYEPEIRALLGTASYFCAAVVLELGTLPNVTTLAALAILVSTRLTQAETRFKVDSPALWYKSVKFCCGNDLVTRLMQS